MNPFINIKTRLLSALATAAVAGAVALSSCSAVYDDLPECELGVRMRFVYDYNMEYANAFHNQVDCLTLYVYDSEGNYVDKITETDEVLSDEGWRMTLPLGPGHYTAVAYGGIECGASSFTHPADPASGTLDDLQLRLSDEIISDADGHRLHDLFYGSLEFEIDADDTGYREVTMKMMKDTNHFRIVLQNLSGEALDGRDFDFAITDRNIHFDRTNNLLPSEEFTYLPWVRGQASTAEDDELSRSRAEGDVSVGYAELSTSRVMMDREPVLTVYSHEKDKEIIRIPLRRYMLLLKSDYVSKMDSQEFLDRQSRWNFIFLLDSQQRWVEMQIVVGPWVVRVHDKIGL